MHTHPDVPNKAIAAKVQDLHGGVAWPTLLLFAAGTSLFSLACWLALEERIPTGLAVALNTLALYLLFTPAHEAVHGNICSRTRAQRTLQVVVGYISAAAFLFPYPVFSYVHRTHHKHTNHPERDPDYWVASRNPARVLFGCATMLPDYYYFYFSRLRQLLANSAERANLGWTVACLFGLAVAFTAMGATYGWWTPVTLWLVPALLASTFLAFIFDYLPHRPHTERRRYRDTRITLFPGAEFLLVSQNLHLIHHLYPSIPYYRYGEAFKRLRSDLEGKGARIDTLLSASSANRDVEARTQGPSV